MKSHAIKSYLDSYAKLPTTIQEQAREAFKRFQADPNHPSLQFKRLSRSKKREKTYSVRVNDQYRALAREEHGELYWYWIGSHSEYDKLI